MILKNSVLLLFLTAQISILGQPIPSKTPKNTQRELLEEYYHLNLIVFQKNSTLEDIERIFDLFTDDFTYVHPHYGGVYSREDLYNGYVRNQQNGGYDGSVIDIKVVNIIEGLNAISVSKKFITREKGKQNESEPQMAVFEFREGKISRIYEYW